jgi:hypothetical protein
MATPWLLKARSACRLTSSLRWSDKMAQASRRHQMLAGTHVRRV